MGDSGGSSAQETRMLIEIQDLREQGLLCYIAQRIHLHFVHALRLCGKLCVKVMN
jgi:hypothetical protein